MAFADEHALREAIRRDGPKLARIAYSRLRDWTLAGEAVTEAFKNCELTAAALKRGREYSYVRRAVINECNDIAKERARERNVELTFDPPEPEVDHENDAFERAVRLLSYVTPQQRKACELRFIEGMSANEVAVQMDISAGRVNHLVSDALATMRNVPPDRQTP